MSGYSGLPSRPMDAGEPMQSPERDHGGYARGDYPPPRHADPPPHFDSAYRGHEGPSDRHWEGGREYDDRYDDYDRKRRRSPSPSYPYQRPRHRSPSPPPRAYRGGGAGGHSHPDPASLEYLLTFKQFAEWFRQSHPQTARDDDEDLRRIRADVESGRLPESVLIEKHGMAKRYERYRKEYTSRQLFGIYLTHREEAWFIERYSPAPEQAALRRRVNRQGRVPSVQQYITELREGKWDEANFDQTDEPRAPEEEPEGLDHALGEDAYDPLRIEVPPRPGQVFVKTVPPSTARQELESVFDKHPGFQWLALSEPSAKRSFHRVGWAQYADDVNVEDAVTTIDGSKVDNFTFHMGVNGTPIVGRIRVAPPLANTLSRLETDARLAADLARTLEDELIQEDTPVPEAEPEADKPVEEQPATEEAKAEAKAEGEENVEEKSDDKVETKPEPKPEPKAPPPGIHERGSDAVADVVARLLASEGLDGEELEEEQRARKAKITLDQYMAYLRHGLNTCYYCVVPTAFPEELQRKCVGHVRAQPEPASTAIEEENGHPEEDRSEVKPEGVEGAAEDESREPEEHERRDSATGPQAAGGKRYTYPTKSNDERWAESLELKVRGVTEDVDVVEYGGRDIEDETKRLTAPCIKQEDADKYRCKQCLKLFRAPEFVIKHVISKHPESVRDKLDDFVVFNAFVLDPQHIPPSANTLAAIDDQLPIQPGALPAFNPSKAQAMLTAAAANQPGFNMAMQQQMMMMMHMQMMMSGGGSGGAGSSTLPGAPAGAASASAAPMASPAGKSRDFDAVGGLPAAPPGGEDPRARKGRVSYRDLDEPSGAGDPGLPY